mmetsp:Transcript_9030/g.11745  ORF Transcript_9030/g.11745 Transcript_9030/m.11745 type:complete len:202 (+) Transcript_9030:172-777(+)
MANRASLPLGRVKQVMKQDEEVGKIKSEALELIAHATERFLIELSQKAAQHSQQKQSPKPVSIDDLVSCLELDPRFDFLQESIQELNALKKGKPEQSRKRKGQNKSNQLCKQQKNLEFVEVLKAAEHKEGHNSKSCTLPSQKKKINDGTAPICQEKADDIHDESTMSKDSNNVSSLNLEGHQFINIHSRNTLLEEDEEYDD